MSRFKQIKKVDDFDNDNPDACMFLISYTEDMKDITLTLKANRPMTPEEYFESLCDFVNNISENPANLFVESVDNNDNQGLH